jgi:DNA-binding PadR family transcriptional regulator
MHPSPNESRVLERLCLLWAARDDAYGPTLRTLSDSFIGDGWAPTHSTVRSHLLRLEIKGHVERSDRRRHGGEFTWSPTDRGRLYLYDHLLPRYSKDGRYHGPSPIRSREAAEPDLEAAVDRFLLRIPERWGRRLHHGPGWIPIILALDSYLSVLVPGYEVHQCKEKFGTLRFYWAWPEGTPETVRGAADLLVRAAEVASAHTCELCGTHDDVRIRKPNGFWIRSLCPRCAAGEARQ